MDEIAVRTTTTQLALKYRAIALKSSGRRITRYPSTALKMSRFLRMSDVVEVDLRVIYIRNGVEVGSNEGHYTNRADWLIAWAAFNDPEIIGL